MGTSVLSWYLSTIWVPVRQIRYPGAVLTPLGQTIVELVLSCAFLALLLALKYLLCRNYNEYVLLLPR